MNVLLVDDEPHNCELMQTLLELHAPDDVQVVGQAFSVQQARKLLEENAIDLVFLDIQMPDQDGFELLANSDHQFEVIFVTSFDNYGLPAIKADAVEYLLKPVDIRELKLAVAKAKKRVSVRNLLSGQLAGEQKETFSKLAVHEGDKVVYVNVEDIQFFSAEGRYTHIVARDGKTYTMAKNLKLVADQLLSDPRFVRINRSILLNAHYVTRHTKHDPYLITMADGTCFEVSRRKRTEVLSRLKIVG